MAKTYDIIYVILLPCLGEEGTSDRNHDYETATKNQQVDRDTL